MSHWRHAVQEALGPNARLIVNLIPEVEFLIGKQPPVPDMANFSARHGMRPLQPTSGLRFP